MTMPISSPYIPVAALDTDAALAANSDAKVPSQKAVKDYVDTAVAGASGGGGGIIGSVTFSTNNAGEYPAAASVVNSTGIVALGNVIEQTLATYDIGFDGAEDDDYYSVIVDLNVAVNISWILSSKVTGGVTIAFVNDSGTPINPTRATVAFIR